MLPGQLTGDKDKDFFQDHYVFSVLGENVPNVNFFFLPSYHTKD